MRARCAWLLAAGCASGSAIGGAGGDAGAPDGGAGLDAGSDAPPEIPSPDARADAPAIDAPAVDAPAPDAAAPDLGAPDGPSPDGACTVSAELLGNADFDLGPGTWSETGTYAIVYFESDTPVAAHSGDYLAWLGGYSSADDDLRQTVALPAGTTTLALSFYYQIATVETPGTVDDTLDVEILDGAGALVDSVVQLEDEDAVSAWTLYSATVGWLGGTTAQLRFHGLTDADAGFLGNTNFFVDTVSLTAVCP